MGLQKMGSLQVNIPGAQLVGVWSREGHQPSLGTGIRRRSSSRMVWDSSASVVMDKQKIHLARSRGLEWGARNDVDQPGASHDRKP